GEFSMELCGGTHVQRAGDIGLFKIVSEGGVASGVRRIEALTGEAALDYVDQNEVLLRDLAALVRGTREELPDKVREQLERARERFAARRPLQYHGCPARGAAGQPPANELTHQRSPGAERWPSGRRRTPAKGVRVISPSRVRIPLSPPNFLTKSMPRNLLVAFWWQIAVTDAVAILKRPRTFSNLHVRSP